MARVIVVVEGGVVQTVVHDDQAIEVVVIDYDTDGLEEEDITKINGVDAYVYRGSRGDFAPNEVDEIFKQIDV